jgi:hypothetical protein
VFFINETSSPNGTLTYFVNPYIDRSAYSVPYSTSVGLCNGSIAGWDGNLTLDNSYAAVKSKYGDTHFTGTHDGSANAAALADSTAAWTTNSFAPSTGVPGATVYNVTDGSKCPITSNTGTGVTCTLTGGTGNNWDAGDTYRITDGYPCRDQLGRVYDDPQWDVSPLGAYAQELRPMYVWGNSEDGAAKDSVVPTAGSATKIISNRDYYTQQSASCTAGGACTSGVGSGSAKPTSCTVGTGFYDTDDSTLYTCTDDDPVTWTAKWTAATCPHPLADAADAYDCDSTIAGTGGYWLETALNPFYNVTLSIADNQGGTLSFNGVEAVESGGDSTAYTATPFNGWKFTGWSGTCGCTGTGTCAATNVTAACTVIATFESVKLLN